MSHHSDLIDTTEMYLRTVYELEEEGVVPLRARIAERLSQSGPTVSQTVARMERDGLVHVAGDRQLQLSDQGRREAIAVMRKHRLAERLLADVIGLDWEHLHVEACRWEHVISEAVERRIVALLTPPFVCPHGNPIPGLEELGLSPAATSRDANVVTLTVAADSVTTTVIIDGISEQLQSDPDLLHRLAEADLLPGHTVTIAAVEPAAVEVRPAAGIPAMFDHSVTDHVFVHAAREVTHRVA
jgi:DtxR family transcriptional regulator, Mn-dependent transcriptional regulator